MTPCGDSIQRAKLSYRQSGPNAENLFGRHNK